MWNRLGVGYFPSVSMERPSEYFPAQTSLAETRHQPVAPLWAAIALVLSGGFLIVVATPDLLFFLGLVLFLLGLYLLLRRRDSRGVASSGTSPG